MKICKDVTPLNILQARIPGSSPLAPPWASQGAGEAPCPPLGNTYGIKVKNIMGMVDKII